MKENFDRYVACQDSIIAVMKLLEDEFSKLDNENVLESLSLSLRNSIENCDQFVRPLLYRKKRMDCIRNTLNVLQRFKFLFQLPQNLKFSMKTGNYGHAVNEILKAEILYNTSDVHLFKLAMSKVRKVKAEMIQTFYDKLKDKNCTLKQSKKFISYLTELLGESADPGWECIKILSNNIISTLKDAEEQSKNDLLKLSNDQAPYEKIAVEFVNKANECFVSHFSSLWQLSQSYFHGTFHKKMTEVVLKNLQDNKVDFEGLCSSVVKEYELLFERAFWPSDGTLPRMDLKFITDPLPLIRCIEVIFAGYENVSHLQYIHASITSSLFSLAIKFRTYCLKPILHQTLIDIEELKKWDIFVRFLEEPTWLCEEYASIIENCLLSIAHVVNMEINMPNSQNLQVNTESNPKAASFLVKRMLSIYFSHIVQFFRYYAFESPLTEEVEMYKSDSQNYNILLGTPGEEASALTTELDTNGLHVQFQRYLRVVTWCIHSRNIVVPTLCRLFEDRFGLGLEEEQQNINEEFEDLKKEALENYIQSKTKVLAQQLDLCLLVPRMNEGVREFVSVLLHELITIYYEVDCTGTNLTKDVFHVLIKNAMSRCSQAVLDANEGKIPAIKGSSITRLWNKQMLIDLRALKLFTGQHFTTEAEQLFVEIKEFLLESSDPAEESHNKQVLENFKTENQFGITSYFSSVNAGEPLSTDSSELQLKRGKALNLGEFTKTRLSKCLGGR
ncbi:exocyst complex component 2-like [Zophobas morio]|uniref:exocyst complex component 2-like n=1 Tax=Zophobas morio TaxID=2755281 RepID=UPI003083CF0A